MENRPASEYPNIVYYFDVVSLIPAVDLNP